MEEAKKKMLYEQLRKLSNMASEICSQLHYISDEYYEYGVIHDKISHLALDADELAGKLNDNTLLSDTIAAKINGEVVEIGVGDLVSYMKMNGQIYDGTVTEFFEGYDESDVVVNVMDKLTKKDMGGYHIRRIIPWRYYYNLYQKNWNKLVEELYDKKKSVSLSQQNGSFNLKVFNHITGATYHRNGLNIQDFNNDLFNKIEEL